MKSVLQEKISFGLTREETWFDLDAIFTAKSILVTGTDTGIGKTYVTSLIIKTLLKKSLNVSAIKPIETGCRPGAGGRLCGVDVEDLAHAQALSFANTELAYKLFSSPVAPLVAARHEGEKINWQGLIQFIEQKKEQAKGSVFLTEGAGGLLVPIAKSETNRIKTYADLALETGLSVLLVFGCKLGAINQAALTFEVLRARKIPICGYVYNQMLEAQPPLPGQTSSGLTNAELLREVAQQYGINEVGRVSFQARV